MLRQWGKCIRGVAYKNKYIKLSRISNDIAKSQAIIKSLYNSACA